MAASAAVKAELETSKQKFEAEQRRLMALEVVDTTFSHLSVLASWLTPTHLALITAWVLAILAAYFLLTEVLQLIRNILEASMCHPTLVQKWVKGQHGLKSRKSACCSSFFADVVSDGSRNNKYHMMLIVY